MTQFEMLLKIERMHTSATALHGKDWPKKRAEWEPIIHAAMKKHKMPVLEAAIQLGTECKEEYGSGMAIVNIFAVAYEMIIEDNGEKI